jgi:hypothetical protein
MLCIDHVTCYLSQSDEGVAIGYNMNCINVLKWSREDSSPYVN